MSLQRRITVLSALAVGIAVTLAASVSYFAVDAGLRSGIDGALRAQASLVQSLPRVDADPADLPAPPSGGRSDYAQRLDEAGAVVTTLPSNAPLPVDDRARSVARGQQDGYLTDSQLDGADIRVLTVPLRDGERTVGAVQLGRSLSDVNGTLATLRLVLIVLCLMGVALAGVFGMLISRRVVAPIRELTQTAHIISRTRDLSRRISLGKGDEIADLAAEFNAMLDALQASHAALDRSVLAQRHLVADASHELRTPVTTLRANLELLEQADELNAEDRSALISDLTSQAEELSDLVTDVIELARGAEPTQLIEDVRLDLLVREAVARARPHAPTIEFRLTTTPVSVDGVPERLARAVNNLIGNAAKYGRADGVVEVVVDIEGVSVRDRGNGIAAEDLEHVFDRFYRSISVRGRPGTGLGLAIVKQVAETHHGSVEATNAHGGGALLRLRLPCRRVDALALLAPQFL